MTNTTVPTDPCKGCGLRLNRIDLLNGGLCWDCSDDPCDGE